MWGKSPLAGRKTPVGPGEIDPDLARGARARRLRRTKFPRGPAQTGAPHREVGPPRGAQKTHSGFPPCHPPAGRGRRIGGVAATNQAFGGAAARGASGVFATSPWVPHRPPRPEKIRRRPALRHQIGFRPEGLTSPRRSLNWWRASSAATACKCCSASPGPARTFTMAQVIEATQRPALILAPNKTLAAQLYGEFRSFFPDNAVEYFVSLLRLLPARSLCAAHRHLYREGGPSINEQIDRNAPFGDALVA